MAVEKFTVHTVFDGQKLQPRKVSLNEGRRLVNAGVLDKESTELITAKVVEAEQAAAAEAEPQESTPADETAKAAPVAPADQQASTKTETEEVN